MIQIDPNEKDIDNEKNFFSEDIPVEERTSVAQSRKRFFKGTLLTILFGAIIILPLSLNYQKFNSGILFYNSIYEKAGKVCEIAVNTPVIKELSIQGTGVIIAIDPFPNDEEEDQRLKTELERATGLQVFLQSPSFRE